MNNKSPEVEIT